MGGPCEVPADWPSRLPVLVEAAEEFIRTLRDGQGGDTQQSAFFEAVFDLCVREDGLRPCTFEDLTTEMARALGPDRARLLTRNKLHQYRFRVEEKLVGYRRVHPEFCLSLQASRSQGFKLRLVVPSADGTGDVAAEREPSSHAEVRTIPLAAESEVSGDGGASMGSRASRRIVLGIVGVGLLSVLAVVARERDRRWTSEAARGRGLSDVQVSPSGGLEIDFAGGASLRPRLPFPLDPRYYGEPARWQRLVRLEDLHGDGRGQVLVVAMPIRQERDRPLLACLVRGDVPAWTLALLSDDASIAGVVRVDSGDVLVEDLDADGMKEIVATVNDPSNGGSYTTAIDARGRILGRFVNAGILGVLETSPRLDSPGRLLLLGGTRDDGTAVLVVLDGQRPSGRWLDGDPAPDGGVLEVFRFPRTPAPADLVLRAAVMGIAVSPSRCRVTVGEDDRPVYDATLTWAPLTATVDLHDSTVLAQGHGVLSEAELVAAMRPVERFAAASWSPVGTSR